MPGGSRGAGPRPEGTPLGEVPGLRAVTLEQVTRHYERSPIMRSGVAVQRACTAGEWELRYACREPPGNAPLPVRSPRQPCLLRGEPVMQVIAAFLARVLIPAPDRAGRRSLAARSPFPSGSRPGSLRHARRPGRCGRPSSPGHSPALWSPPGRNSPGEKGGGTGRRRFSLGRHAWRRKGGGEGAGRALSSEYRGTGIPLMLFLGMGEREGYPAFSGLNVRSYAIQRQDSNL